MQTRFVLPVIAATAFHALVFFGFDRFFDHPVAPPVPPEPEVKLPPFPTIVPVDIEEVTPPAPGEKQEQKRRWGETDIVRPSRPEPPPIDGGVFIPVPPVDLPPGTNLGKIPPIWGDPAGDPDSDSVNVPIDLKYLDNVPRARSQIAPVYPASARADGLQGQVMVEMLVDETGRVINAWVVRSTNPIFEGPTLRAVQQWRFEPGKKAGRTVRFRMAAPVVFSLDR